MEKATEMQVSSPDFQQNVWLPAPGFACIFSKIFAVMASDETYYSVSTLVVEPENLDKVSENLLRRRAFLCLDFLPSPSPLSPLDVN